MPISTIINGCVLPPHLVQFSTFSKIIKRFLIMQHGRCTICTTTPPSGWGTPEGGSTRGY